MYETYHSGWIETITGSMFSGKSEELIRRLRRGIYAKQKVVVFKPAIDDRYHKEKVVSHNGNEIEAINISTAQEILNHKLEEVNVIGIDEVQFFEDDIVNIVEKLAENGHRVIVAGLDMDFRGEPFKPMPKLLAVSEHITKLQAVCSVCGSPSSRTQRLINGEPAKVDDPIILVGANESYEPRCRAHHIVAPSENEKEEIVFDQLDIVEERYEQLNELLSDPDVVNDADKLRKYSKEQADLQKTVDVYRSYKTKKEELQDIEDMLNETSDKEEVEMLKEESSALKTELPDMEEELKILLIPKDPNDDKDVIVEIRAAAGGDEAAIFAGDLMRMYSKYAEANGFKTEIVEASESDHGGYKEVSFSVSGTGAYSKLKFENGAHRVQRVPETESGGRIHTSTATVAVLPEAEDVEIEIRNEDLKIDTYRSSGAGGQHVNTTDSAVRITHLPTGVIATSSEKSQIQNREKAMKVLKARLYDMKLQEEQQKYASQRKSAVGTGDRSERIRTYNYPQSRVTDHRIGLTLQKLNQIMEGNLDEIVEALTLSEQTEKLKELNNGEL